MRMSILLMGAALGLAGCGGTTIPEADAVQGAAGGPGVTRVRVTENAPQPALPNAAAVSTSASNTGGSVSVDVGLPQGGGYAYEVDYTLASATTRAGLSAGIELSPMPSGGTASFVGVSDLTVVTGLGSGNNPSVTTTRSPFTVDIDFDDGSFSGSGGGLSVNGTFSDNTASGTSTVAGLQGTLDAVVASDQAIGIVTGANSSFAYAGGFVAIE